MSRQEERSITLYDGKAYGHKVSEYGLEHGYLDYLTLSKIVGDCVLNNSIVPYIGFYEWELVNGCEENEEGWYEVYQYYIITDSGASFLQEHTDEIVYYHEDLDMYVWGITHFGTSCDYVLTDIKLRKNLSFVDDIGYTEFSVAVDWYNKQENKEDIPSLFERATHDESSDFRDLTGRYL